MNIDNWKQANQVYTDLVHLSKADAIHTLEGINDIKPEIEKIVMSLITSGEQSSQYFDENVNPGYVLESINLSRWQAGNEIGDYQLIEKIGMGGMSKVFSAKRKNSDVQKLVAIKIFSPNVNSSLLQKRFLEEQKILSGLSHPNIITMLHGETTESGESFIAMELIENAVSLEKYVKKKSITTHQKVQMVLDTAKALSYAHNNLIIHRDIKPTNIIVSVDGIIKVVDFGIAKQITNSADDKATIMALTPSFASPEQINAQAITVATDIFSLAAVCVAIIIGESPLPKDRLLKSGEGDEEHLRKVFKTHNFDKDLRNVLKQALAHDPKKRYNSMDKFAEDLKAWLSSETVSATPDSLIYRLSKFAKRRKALFASILTLVFSMTIALIALSWQYSKTRIEAQKAQQVKQFMLDAFSVTDPNISQGVEISAKDILKIASDKLNYNSDLDENIKFDLYQTIGIAYGQLGFLNVAIENLKHSLAIKPDDSKSLSIMCMYLLKSDQPIELEKQLETVNEESFTSTEDKNRILRIKVRLFAINGELESAFQLIEKFKDTASNPMEYIANQRLMAEVESLNGNPNRSIELIINLLMDIDLKPNHTLIFGVNNDLISYYNKVGDYDSALKVNEKTINQLRLILGDKHPELAHSLNQLSLTYRQKGDMENAYNVAFEAHQIFVQLYGENSLGSAQSISKLAMLSYLNGNHKEATEQFIKSSEIYETIYSADHMETLKEKVKLAGLYTATGEPQKAQELLQNVFQIQKNKLGSSHLSTLLTQQHLARALTALNKLPEALHHAEINYTLAKNHHSDHSPIVDGAEFILAKTYFKSNQFKQALELFITREGKSKKDNHTYANLLWDIAKTYVALENFEQAENYFKKSILAYDNVYSSLHIRSLRMRLIYASFLQSQDRITESKTIIGSVTEVYDLENIKEPRLLIMIDKLKQKFIQTH